MPFNVLADAVYTTVVSYTLGSGSITVASVVGFPTPSTTAPILVTVITAASYGTEPETFATYQATGVTSETFTGLTLIDGTDTAWAAGAIVEMRVCARHFAQLQAALATSIATVAAESTLTGSRKLTAGANITLTDGGAGGNLTISSTAGGTGTVTSVSVVSANGLGGSVATATTTPAITLTTTATGVLKGSSGSIVAATAGTDYLASNQTITLSGDATGSGTTAITTALATVNSNTGTFGGSTAIPSITVNAKGLITAVATNAVVAPAGTLSGTTLNATIVTSSLTQVGTITSGTWQGTPIAASYLAATGLVIAQATHPTTADTDGATITFNLATTDWHSVVLGGNRTLALSNPSVDQQFSIILRQDGTGSRTVTWFSGILWPGGTAPTLTTTVNKRDVFSFKCLSSGVYLGFVVGQNM